MPLIHVKPARGQVPDLLERTAQRAAAGERVLITALTKRLAEDLAQYIQEEGLRCRYLHSEINTLERIEILRELRAGKFDALVGVNLLREGLDLPEVSLVAILDADKEGFLRRTTSLIQTIGRTARNVNAEVILYADKITDSMRRAIDETDRRREKQLLYNAEHGITPESIKKDIGNVMQSVYERSDRFNVARVTGLSDQEQRALESPEGLRKYIGKLHKNMLTAAENLEFEDAAKLRDEIKRLEQADLGL